uniref:Transposase MuDR plant domain-containing protein n=1 Tax=Cannabis sativa TaxID=3483 RepID=A0A803PYR9_CANSA
MVAHLLSPSQPAILSDSGNIWLQHSPEATSASCSRPEIPLPATPTPSQLKNWNGKKDPTTVTDVLELPTKLEHCVIEELPPDAEVVADVVGIPVPIGKGKDTRDSKGKQIDVVKISRPTQNQPNAVDPIPPQPSIIDPTTSQHQTRNGTQHANNEEYFEFHEEEYEQDVQAERNIAKPIDASKWWSSVTYFCYQCGQGNEWEGDGVESEDDLQSLASDDEEVEKGMIFATVEALRKALREYFIANDKDFKYISNDKRRVRATCKGNGCKWLIFASRVNSDESTFQVRKPENTHSCGIVLDNRLTNSEFLAKHFLDSFKLNPNFHFSAFKEMVSNTKFFKISKWTFYRAKNIALEMLEGFVVDQYAILDDYCKQILLTNPDSTTKI